MARTKRTNKRSKARAKRRNAARPKTLVDLWKWQADRVKTPEQLAKFITKLSRRKHNYASIIHACYTAMLGALRVMDHGPQGGITGFQAGLLGWLLTDKFLNHPMPGSPMRLIKFSDMLFPQHKKDFAKYITPKQWKWVQQETRKLMRETRRGRVHTKVMEHWQSILSGKVPFGYRVREEK